MAGFNVHVPLLHEDLERFVDQVVPILQAEGAFPRSYDGATIRDRFGLPYPLLHGKVVDDDRLTARAGRE